jgi:TubC N-terminal docking domain
VSTPSTLLANLYRRGAALRVRGDRLGVKAPDGVLTPEIQSALKTHKLQLLELVVLAGEYQKLLRDAFALLLRPEGPSSEDADTFFAEQGRAMDELGPDLAATIYTVTARRWRQETGVCPWCDEAGECHEPADPTPA